MKKAINEKYTAPVSFRNDIYRKFEKQFKYCFLNPVNIDDNLYVEHSTEEYKNSFEIFFNSYGSDVKFFIGYTGVGKTTFTKHFLGYKTLGISFYNSDGIIIPNSWDGIKVSENYVPEINEQISNVLDSVTTKLYKPYEEIINTESDDILTYISETRNDIIPSLTLQEMMFCNQSGYTKNQYKIQKAKEKHSVETSSLLLKYVMEKHNINNINRLIFIVDDLETLSQNKVRYIVESYFAIYACMHNTRQKLIVNLLINVRPHSFRFLKDDINHQYISAYGNYLQLEAYRLIKNRIPDIKKIFINRFDDAIKNTPNPGNPKTWNKAKDIFYDIINEFDDNIIETICDLCHLNIRAITDCFQMILSNRIWCQDFKEISEHPKVKKGDYRFDKVNVIRTIACGENSLYTGQNEMMSNPQNLSNIQSRPSFDDSKVFIPNILIDPKSRECDILPAIVIEYLDGYLSSKSNTSPQTEFISKSNLCDNLVCAFGNMISVNKIKEIIDYLFENRIIRKSIISKDSDEKINSLEDNDLLYLTLKGSRLLQMLENDSILVEIYREDIKRIYNDEKYYKSSSELISENTPEILFKDLILLCHEIFYSEDNYQKYIYDSEEMSSFYKMSFPITTRIIKGIKLSLHRSINIQTEYKLQYQNELKELEQKIANRINEMQT